MTRSSAVVAVAALGAAIVIFAAPSVFPTGTTIYDPAKTWNGYTVLSPLGGDTAIVIDMNGKVVKRWEGYNSSAGGPVRVLPGGFVIGAAGANAGKQESLALIARDFAGKELWRFDHNEQITAPAGPTWALRQHHDWQRDDFPAGYYAPGATPVASPNAATKTLVLTHTNHTRPAIAGETLLEDDRLIELGADGKVTWEWVVGDHIEDFRFDNDARVAIRGGAAAGRGAFDWFHMNSATYVGPNHWFDQGDKRFAPENVVISSREASLIAIVARDGKIVWQIGPDYGATPELRAIRQVIGQHNAHFIPKGLPGAGNLMVFDNGGASVYGRPSATSLTGRGIYARATSRILEIDPVSLQLVWSYTAPAFFATNISGAQRLLNGNTLITEGPDGRLFEVTKEGAIVWEYVYPVFGAGKARVTNSVYRAYRVPYTWIPQLAGPAELAVTPPNAGDFRVK
ncbi:MAG: aryl-sulfate sulfotransferase [Acidobacteriota bacterium]